VLTAWKKLLFSSVMVVLGLTLMEGFSYVAASYVADHFVLLYKEQGDSAQYADYLAYRDTLLGWPSPLQAVPDRDRTGSRINPAYPDPGRSRPCISLYGDSYTYSAEVDSAHAWSNLLSRAIHCRVANYGAGGYGTDQSYLKFQVNPEDSSRIVILGIFAENIMRNVNQYRNLFYRADFGLKPRFIVDPAGKLQLIPLPPISPADYVRFIRNPNPFLPYEYFKLNGPNGPAKFQFPYTWSLVQSVHHFRVVAALTGKPQWADFYQKDHPSGSLQVTEKIALGFRDLAVARGKHPVVLLIPHPLDIRYFREKGAWSYENLIALLRDDGVDVVNVGVGLNDYLKARDPYDLMGRQHYNEEGYQVIADVVYRHLAEAGLMDSTASDTIR
jgi:hypothetical protein